MNQPTLFDTPAQGRARRNDPLSSQAAARKVDTQRQRNLLRRELSAALYGLTCDELESRTRIPRYVVASRLSQMRRDGEVYPQGFRQNAGGRSVQVWYSRG